MERPYSVLLTDLDGVVFWRVPAQKAGIPFIGKLNPEAYQEPLNLGKIKNDSSGREVTPFMVWQALRHIAAPVFPDVASLLKETDIKFIFGNTGRHHNIAMLYATWLSLSIAHIANRFTDVYFRPKGLTTLGSKMLGVGRTIKNVCDEKEILIVDDNPYDLLPITRNFPGTQGILIRDLTTDRLLRGVNLKEDFPNITVHKTLRQALLFSY